MSGLVFLIPTLMAIVISMLLVRAGAIALTMTGMNYETAKFQALSAFSGTGFTTREAERIVNNAKRRKIVSWLMVLGNVGIVTVIVAATTSFGQSDGVGLSINFIVLIMGIVLIAYLTKKTKLIKRWEAYSRRRLSKLKIFIDDVSIDELLHFTEGFGVMRIGLLANSPLIGRTLSEINSDMQESFALGVERDKNWYPAPGKDRELEEGDFLVMYGKLHNLSKYFE